MRASIAFGRTWRQDLRARFLSCVPGKTSHRAAFGRDHGIGNEQGNTEAKSIDDFNTAQSLTFTAATTPEYVLLSTAIVQITEGQSKIHEGKDLLDEGSQT